MKVSVEGPRFFSAKDEDVFFSWVDAIPSIVSIEGTGKSMNITFAKRRISQRDLREILALFHRYGLDKRVLACFDRSEWAWFRDPKSYWFAEVFGRNRAHC
jgi:hypothetical protein